MKHEHAEHFDDADCHRVVRTARPDQILRLLHDIRTIPRQTQADASEVFHAKD